MSDLLNKFDDYLKNDGPVAIIIKQFLRPVEGRDAVIFPPTYPMPTYRGRVHTVRDGEYRVSVELPPFRQENDRTGKKSEEELQTVAGYNIDEFKDGTNICEIDSPQSQGNRLEPLFKTIKDGTLVPQITIQVGSETVNLLDVGHRAADAVIRLSSLVAEFHNAFTQVQKGNHLDLAGLAPTSLLFGVWDSRGTQAKLPRIIKAEIRATDVQLCTRSAQFNPAIDYVKVGAVDEDLDKGSGEKNPLGAEGMKHVPAPRTAGGVKVHGDIQRVVRINLVALRGLRALVDGKCNQEKTNQLQRYVLGLALVVATHSLPLNLREGCLLCLDEKTTESSIIVSVSGQETNFPNGQDAQAAAQAYAEQAARDFFGDKFDQKNVADARFEVGVANKFLAMSSDDRKKLARSGAITEEAIKRFTEMGRDPIKLVSDAIKEAKTKLSKKTGGKKAAPVVVSGFFNAVLEKLNELVNDEPVAPTVSQLVEDLREVIASDQDTHETVKKVDDRIKEFNKQKKESAIAKSPAVSSEAAIA